MLPYPTILIRSASSFILVPLVFIACHAPVLAAAQPIDRSSIQTIRPETTAGLQTFFQTLDYDWVQLENGVPPLILENIPADIENSASIETKKRTFFMGLLPMVLLANQEIAEERMEILQILQKHESSDANPSDRERLAEISKRYGLRGRPITDHRARTQLLQRVGTIPTSMVLAQAANESAWGTSRFARLGNNLFGEWTFKPGTGIVPAGRPPGETYEVRKFSSLYESIRSYMNNLNRNGAYRKLREVRAELRKAEQTVTGMALAQGLLHYSQRGEEYIREIQAMIRQNKLSRTEIASLRQPKIEVLTSIRTSGSGFFSTRNRSIGHLSPSRLNPELAEPVP
ncbi:MAG: glucosaminidase domain-containing protein [Desulfuromonadales bacterium]|nr:glucosaminidase domain-containing protein [Desulfuromonadales bacterium]